MITFLTWNLAMLERPADAPHSWSQGHTEAAVREVVLAVAPDVVLFQELPGLVPFVETHGMAPANPATHNGNLATLVSHRLLAEKPTTATVTGCGLLVSFGHLDITIANVHLAPGKGGADERLHQVAQVVTASPTHNLLLAGDTNTRLDEAEALVDLGLATEKPPEATWDSRRNRFNTDLPEFSAYFTRWFTGGALSVTDVAVLTEPVDHQGHRFHVSDHYALTGTIHTDGAVHPDDTP